MSDRHLPQAFVRLFLVGFVALMHLSSALSEDARTQWSEEPSFGNQLKFIGMESLREKERQFQRYRFKCATDFQECRIEAEIPALEPLEEFTAEARVNSTHAGIRLGVRLVLPNQVDPKTGRPLTTWLLGNCSTQPSEWQRLQVALTRAEIEGQLIRVRAEFAPTPINASGRYIDRCGLWAQFNRGDCAIDVEPVSYGPIVRRIQSVDSGVGEPDGMAKVAERTSRLRVERSQVFLNNEGIFLKMIPDHGESLEQILVMGLNAIWTAGDESGDRLRELADANIVIAATPPHTKFDPADFQRPVNGLLPLEHQMPLADLFVLGTEVKPQQLPHLLSWAEQVHSSDRVLRRPILAHVTDSEGLASRQIDMVGVGMPATHRNLTYGQSRNQIFHKRRRASQMTLPWTWIQTESPTAMTDWRKLAGLPPLVVEPEQITMQVVAALSAGTRAIAFWKTKPFGDGQLEESEVGLAVALASLHIDLFEPWLIASQTQSYIAVDDGRGVKKNLRGAKQSRLSAAVGASSVSLKPEKNGIPRGSDAVVISGQEGSLILVAVWDDSSQYVPGHLYAREASLIATARETSSASQITATHMIGHRRIDRPGGLEVKLNDLDQFAAILVSSNPSVFEEMKRRVQRVRPLAAELQYGIASLKHKRVLATCAEIDRLNLKPPQSAAEWLQNATRMLKSAEAAMQSDRFVEADRQAQGCLRALRSVQNLYWKAAIQQLPTPMASPFTVAFSSLPEHWRMMNTLQVTPPSENLLPSGDFRRRQALEQAGWNFPVLSDNVYTARSHVRYEAQNSTQVLQLMAWKPKSSRPPLATQPSTLVTMPSVQVEIGDIIEVQGRVRLNSRTIRAVEEYPFMIFDSEMGPEFAVRPALATSWQNFKMYRQVVVSGPFRISFALQGSAEVHLDLNELTVRKVGRAEIRAYEPTGEQLRTANGSKVQGAGYSFPSRD
jgi:hypothetical protein